MSAPNRTLASLATEARTYFHRIGREAPGIGTVLATTPDAPQWVRDLCLAAHDNGDLLPDDWRYEFIGDSLASIEDATDEEDEDTSRERFEELVDEAYVYTSQQMAWLASHGCRPGLCDEATEEYGAPSTLLERIRLGMHYELRKTFDSVLASLQTRIEEQEQEGDEP